MDTTLIGGALIGGAVLAALFYFRGKSSSARSVALSQREGERLTGREAEWNGIDDTQLGKRGLRRQGARMEASGG